MPDFFYCFSNGDSSSTCQIFYTTFETWKIFSQMPSVFHCFSDVENAFQYQILSTIFFFYLENERRQNFSKTSFNLEIFFDAKLFLLLF